MEPSKTASAAYGVAIAEDPMSGTAESPTRPFDVRTQSSVLSYLTIRLGFRPWQGAVVCSLIYYGIPFIAASIDGVLISSATAHAQFDPVGLPQFGLWLSRRSNVNLYYATDTVHLVMSLLVLCGSGMLLYTLRNLARVVVDLLDSHKLTVSYNDAAQTFCEATAPYRARAWRLVLFMMALLLAVVIERKTHDPALMAWWGHASHGLAGHVLAAVIGGMVFWGGSWLFLLACGLGGLSDLLKHPVQLEPFHPDGCNGFAKLGDYLITLFVLSVMIAATAWLCLWKGYLGVERLAITWIAGSGGILVIPIILITPLVRCTRRIAAARLARMRDVQAVFEKELAGIEADATITDAQSLSERVRRLHDAQAAVAALYPSNIFPFKPKVAGTLSATYLLQVVLFLREAYNKLIA
jgi:hypothetical protein